MHLALKINNLIINDYFGTFKGCFIEEVNQKSTAAGDKFETTRGALTERIYKVKLKGWEQINQLEIYSSPHFENCVKVQEAFFESLKGVMNTPDAQIREGGRLALNLESILKV